MNTPTIPEPQKRRLQAHFGFTKVPFRKNMWAKEMFDSRSQREMLQGLNLWLEVKGIALATATPGTGKSIGIRRFVESLPESRFSPINLQYATSTPIGFLRSLNRTLGLPMRAHTTDLFDAAQRHLTQNTEDSGPHPILVLDDAEGMSVDNLDLLRRLTAYALDAEDRFSILLVGFERCRYHNIGGGVCAVHVGYRL
jgi:type II secretory pathway predicted ATPase ExeA